MAFSCENRAKFSPNGKLYAYLNNHGILKIWDTETNNLKQEYTPNLHLAVPCTALIWLNVSHENKTKKSRKSFTNNTTDSLYIAFGTNQGGVTLYSYSTGQIERTFKGEGHSGKVTNLTYDNDNLLYTCGEDSQIIIWSIYDEKRINSWSCGDEKPYSITYLQQSNQIVVGARQLKVFSARNLKLIETFTGHISNIIIMDSFEYQNNEYIITASQTERILCVWRKTNVSVSKNPTNSNAICTFLMEDVANCISCKVDSKDDGHIQIAAVTNTGVIHIYSVSISNVKPEKPIKPKVTIKIVSDNNTITEPIFAVTATLNFGFQEKDLLFGYGDNEFLVFEQVNTNYNENIQVLIRAEPKKLLIKHGKKEHVATKTVTPIINNKDVDYQTITSRSQNILKNKQNSVQIPLETRLQNLNLTNGEIPQAQSKVQLLMQSLHSKDANLLRSVLVTDDKKVINLTLQKLPVQYVGCLVNELTLLMEKKRSNVQIAVNWLEVLIKAHASQLMAMGSVDLLQKFGPCLGMIEHRANCLQEISKLNGRLQLLVSQIKRNTTEENLNTENAQLYEDADSSNSDIDMEDENKSISDDEWEEDDDDIDEDEMETKE